MSKHQREAHNIIMLSITFSYLTFQELIHFYIPGFSDQHCSVRNLCWVSVISRENHLCNSRKNTIDTLSGSYYIMYIMRKGIMKKKTLLLLFLLGVLLLMNILCGPVSTVHDQSHCTLCATFSPHFYAGGSLFLSILLLFSGFMILNRFTFLGQEFVRPFFRPPRS